MRTVMTTSGMSRDLELDELVDLRDEGPGSCVPRQRRLGLGRVQLGFVQRGGFVCKKDR